MEDIYGTDLLMEESDLVVSNGGDLELVTDIDCLNQDLLNAFLTPYYFWGLTHQHGSRLQEFVEGGNDDFYETDLKKAVIEVLKVDARIKKDSWNIQFEKSSDTIEITASYLPIGRNTPEVIKFKLG